MNIFFNSVYKKNIDFVSKMELDAFGLSQQENNRPSKLNDKRINDSLEFSNLVKCCATFVWMTDYRLLKASYFTFHVVLLRLYFSEVGCPCYT